MTRDRFYGCVSLMVILAASACSNPPRDDNRFTTWTRYEAEPGATSFSALDQINRNNIDQVEQAWYYEAPGAKDMNPIIVDSLMYVMEDDAIIALHAGTGEKIWTYDSPLPGNTRTHGLTYWESDDRSDRRVLNVQGSFHFYAVDALTGELITAFGEEGYVDLRRGLGQEPELVTKATSPSPAVVYENLAIMGSSPGEGYVASPGHIRAFDVRTGEQVWIFHTLPKKGEYGYETWPEGRSEIGGGANAWGGLSVDDERGIVYVPLGSANYDFYGIDRHGENLFASSLVALNARTGERIWHFQTIHHDIWDYDLTATPVLLTINQDGKDVDIVVLATKMGMAFVFNRETGEPIWPIEERPVPASDVPGEQAWPTQPFTTKPEPFAPMTFDIETDVNPYIFEEDRDSLMQFLRNMRWEGIYTPPSTTPTLQVPGNRGGANWGSTAGDPRDGTFIVLSYNMPSVLHLEPIVAGATGTGTSPFDRGQQVYQDFCQQCHGADLAGQPTAGIPSLIGSTNRLSHDELNNVILYGRNMMPPNAHLSANALESLTLFLTNPELALVQPETVSTGEVPRNEPLRYQSAWRHVLDSQGIPIIRPPWFRLTAYDMNDGEMIWQVPVGEVEYLAEQGITGTGSAMFVRGGPAVTAGGLVFLSVEEMLRVYDLEDGTELHAFEMPAAGEGIPAVYEVDGRQYIGVALTQGERWSQQPANTKPRAPGYIAFALPDTP